MAGMYANANSSRSTDELSLASEHCFFNGLTLLYSLTKQAAWYFASIAMRSPVESLAMRLLSFKRMAHSLTFLYNSRIEARCRLLAKSFFSQKKHCKILGSKGVRLRLDFIGLDWAVSLPSASHPFSSSTSACFLFFFACSNVVLL